MIDVCKVSNIDLEHFKNQIGGSKVKCLKEAFEFYQKEDQTDNRLYDLIRNAIPVDKAIENDEQKENDGITIVDENSEYVQAVNKLNEVFKAPGIDMFFDVVQRYGLVDLKNPPKNYKDFGLRTKLIMELEHRGFPKELLKYCKKQILANDYGGAVFEATKGLFHELRKKLDIREGVDGNRLIDDVMSSKENQNEKIKPALCFNSLQSQQDWQEQKALASLFKAAFAVIRNPPAHKPIACFNWDDEKDLLDYFSILSFLYRKLQRCTVASKL